MGNKPLLAVFPPSCHLSKGPFLHSSKVLRPSAAMVFTRAYSIALQRLAVRVAVALTNSSADGQDSWWRSKHSASAFVTRCSGYSSGILALLNILRCSKVAQRWCGIQQKLLLCTCGEEVAGRPAILSVPASLADHTTHGSDLEGTPP